MARVLVTGATGFVGRRLVARMVARGADELHGLSRTPPARGAQGWTHHQADLTEPAAVARAVQAAAPERVVHLGALAHPGDCARDPARALAVNAGGTAALLDALAGGPARVVLVSTSQVYGPQPCGPIHETAEPTPDNAYGISKLAAERAADGRTVIARPFNHAGPGQEPRYALAAFADQIQRAARGGGPLRHGSLWPRRDFLHVDDVLDAYELLAERGEPGAVYNVCGGESVPIGDLLRGLLERLGPELGTELDPERVREGEAQEVVGDPGRLRALGWAPSRSLQVLLDDVAADFAATA